MKATIQTEKIINRLSPGPVIKATISQEAVRLDTLGVPGPEGPSGPVGPAGGEAFVFVHTESEETTWTIHHNLGVYPNVYVIDTAGTHCEGAVENLDENSLTITFSSNFAGQARLT